MVDRETPVGCCNPSCFLIRQDIGRRTGASQTLVCCLLDLPAARNIWDWPPPRRCGIAASAREEPGNLSEEVVSIEPATGAELWRGRAGDVDELVGAARRAWPAWAAQPHTQRIELVRRFANEVRKDGDKLADLIARETGKPLWEAKTEVEAVVNKVEIAIRAYAERTGQRKLDSALQGTAALRHKPHGVMAVLGPYNFPAHLPNGHIVPALIAGNAIVFKPSEKTPAVGEALVECFHRAGIPAPEVLSVS